MITIVYCTADKSKDKEFELNLKDMSIGDITIIAKECTKQNGKTICKAYNEAMKESKTDLIIFCHNDIKIYTKGFDLILLLLFNNSDYGIIGPVGSNKFDCGSWLGTNGKALGTLIQYTKYKCLTDLLQPKIVLFSPNYRLDHVTPATTVDGMFIAVRRDRIKEPFDECLKGFHFYDVMFTIDNLQSKVKVGVTYDLDIAHFSDGYYNAQWYEARCYCIAKYLNLVFEIPLPGEGGMAISRNYYRQQDIIDFRRQYYFDLKLKNIKQFSSIKQ